MAVVPCYYPVVISRPEEVSDAALAIAADFADAIYDEDQGRATWQSSPSWRYWFLRRCSLLLRRKWPAP